MEAPPVTAGIPGFQPLHAGVGRRAAPELPSCAVFVEATRGGPHLFPDSPLFFAPSAGRRRNRAEPGKRVMNPAKNKVWDSSPSLPHAFPDRFPEPAMDHRVVVLSLLAACLANVACLVAFL